MKRFNGAMLAVFLGLLGIAGAKTAHHGGRAAADFDYYVLALSWSPAFCTGAAGQQAGKAEQCHKALGFVVHGLWPQFNNGKWPHDCKLKGRKEVPAELAALVLNTELPMPPGDPALLSHEWTKHGTCSGLDQQAYFSTIRAAAAQVKIPPELQQPGLPVTMDFSAIVDSFAAVNPGLAAEMLDAHADAKGNVTEIHICFSKALSFQTCVGSTNQDSGGQFLPVSQ